MGCRVPHLDCIWIARRSTRLVRQDGSSPTKGGISHFDSSYFLWKSIYHCHYIITLFTGFPFQSAGQPHSIDVADDRALQAQCAVGAAPPVADAARACRPCGSAQRSLAFWTLALAVRDTDRSLRRQTGQCSSRPSTRGFLAASDSVIRAAGPQSRRQAHSQALGVLRCSGSRLLGSTAGGPCQPV